MRKRIHAVKMMSEQDMDVIIYFIEAIQNIWPNFPYDVEIKAKHGKRWIRIVDAEPDEDDEAPLFI